MSRIMLILTALISLVFVSLLVHSGKTEKQAEMEPDSDEVG
ncbi:hypothetical protein [Ekhidna sp.]